MRLCVAALAVAFCSIANAETICVNGRCSIRQPKVVVHSDTPTSVCVSGCRGVTIVSAQEHADHLAATGTFSHCNRRGGGYEGLGFASSGGPDAACRNACYWGQRRVREIGTAWCPHRRGWIAVVRYE